MKKLITITGILFCIALGTLHAQTQIGETLVGDSINDSFAVNDLNSDGSIMIVGTFKIGAGAGYARVFEFDGTDWVQKGSDITSGNIDDRFGIRVAINGTGDIVSVFAPGNDDNGIDSGEVRVYQYDGVDWVQVGGDINGEEAGDTSIDGLGDIDLSSDGTILAFSAPLNNNGGVNAGHIRVFEYDGNDWVQQGDALEGDATAVAGIRVSLNNDGSRVTVGSSYTDLAQSGVVAFQQGKVGIYEYDGTTWLQVGADILGEKDFDGFGSDAVLNGDGAIVAISAPINGGDGGTFRGRLKVFQFDGTNWVQIGQNIDSDQDEVFAWPISINGDGTVLSYGHQGYDVSGADRGIVRIYKYDGNDWLKRGLDIEGIFAQGREGWSTNISEDGNIVSTGAITHLVARGSARVFDISEILSIDAISNALEVTLYPNPASNTINITGNSTDLVLSIYDMLGREIRTQTVTNQLDVSFLPSGTYIVHLTDGTKTTTSKLIKK